MCGERFGHEAYFNDGRDACAAKSVKDLVGDRPVVEGIAGAVFTIGVGRTPLEGRVPIAGCQEIMGAEIDRRFSGRGLERRQLRKELFAIGRVSVVRFVCSKIVPNRVVVRLRLVGVNRY